MAARRVTLGIDLGTTSVKAALVEAAPGDPSGFVVLASCARAARAEAAAQSAAAGPQGREQDVSRIIQALNECLTALPREQLRKVCGIGVSGQMHGVMFWKTGQVVIFMLHGGVGNIPCMRRRANKKICQGVYSLSQRLLGKSLPWTEFRRFVIIVIITNVS
uniref:Sedoheptulokinase n=1 Tax=Equus caballus TaxID=9796 RepID=A0A9L0TPJ4_HORSE